MKIIVVFINIICIAYICLATAFASEVRRYDIFLENGKKAGEQVVRRAKDGLIKVRYIFKDDGRGPEYNEEFRLAQDGTLSEYRVTGSLMFGSNIEESYVRKGSMGIWRSTSEQGSRKVDSLAMYMPLKSSYEIASITIGLLGSKSDNILPLLPYGELRQRVLDRVIIRSGNRKMSLQLIAQFGLGLEPKFYWATVGKRPRLFAAIVHGSNPAMSLIEAGWKDSLSILVEHQDAAETKFLSEFSTQQQHELAGLTMIRNARVFDSEKATLSAASDVYLLRGKITAVVPTGALGAEADQIIDAGGRVLLPGLFDMHAHVKRWNGVLDLLAGVTTVRDMANTNDQLQSLINEIHAGRLLAPNVIAAGFIEGISPYTGNYGFVVKDQASARQAIDWYAKHGYSQLKVYGSFPASLVGDAVSYAHSRGMRVSGHVPFGLKADDVLDLGFDELTHMNMVALNFLITPTTDTRSTERITLPAEKMAELDLDSKPVQDFIRKAVDKKVVLDPTLAVMAFMKQRPGHITEVYAPIADHMPPDIRRNYYLGIMNVPEAKVERYEASYRKMIELTGRLYKAGVPLVAGTDTVAFGIHAELELYVRAGLTPAQALQVATRNGALYSRTWHERGSVSSGKLADLVLVDGDPTINIADIRKVALVFTRGNLLYPSEIAKTLGIKPFVDNPPLLMKLPKRNGSALSRVEVGGHMH